jgi:hypothetical protein
VLGLPVGVPLPARSRRPHRLVVGFGERVLERLEPSAARDERLLVRLLLLLIVLLLAVLVLRLVFGG